MEQAFLPSSSGDGCGERPRRAAQRQTRSRGPRQPEPSGDATRGHSSAAAGGQVPHHDDARG